MNDFPKQPNLFILGAPKCGTTAMADYLSGHPDVYLGPIKEPNYWSSDMPSYAKREGLDCFDDYVSLYRNSPLRSRYILDASTHYLYSQVAIRQIYANFPTAKFIVCIRPQHELAQAWHMQMYNAGYEDIEDFEPAWRAIANRRKGKNIPSRCPEPLLLDYQAVSSLGLQIQKLLSIVPTDQVHFISLLDIKDNAFRVYLECLYFLNLHDDGRTEFSPANAAFVNRSNRLSRWIRDPRLRRLLNYILLRLDADTANRLKHKVKQILYKPSPRITVDEAFIDDLKNQFDQDNRLLQRLTGRSFLYP